MNHRRIERVAALGRPPSFVVEDIGDFGAIEAFPAQLGGARRQRRVSAERVEARDRTRQFVRRAASAMPVAFEANPFVLPTTSTSTRSSSSRTIVCGSARVVVSARQSAGKSCISSRIAASSAALDARDLSCFRRCIPPQAAPVRSEPPLLGQMALHRMRDAKVAEGGEPCPAPQRPDLRQDPSTPVEHLILASY